jgi:hypothetical protein
VDRLDESDALSFLYMSLEKGDALLQALHIVHYSHPGIARMAYPATKCPGLVTMSEVEFFGRLTAALTETIRRPRGTVFFAR